jgi:hypothetical protein
MPENTPKTCFVVSPIGPEDSAIRKRSDMLLRILKHALEPRYEVIRSDHIAEPGMISHRMIQLLVDAPLVVADLTGANPNVYYELAIRHAVGKPTIQIIAKGEPIPFDIGDMRTIGVDMADQYAAEDLIRACAKEIEKPGYVVTTPISAALGRTILTPTDTGRGSAP